MTTIQASKGKTLAECIAAMHSTSAIVCYKALMNSLLMMSVNAIRMHLRLTKKAENLKTIDTFNELDAEIAAADFNDSMTQAQGFDTPEKALHQAECLFALRHAYWELLKPLATSEYDKPQLVRDIFASMIQRETERLSAGLNNAADVAKRSGRNAEQIRKLMKDQNDRSLERFREEMKEAAQFISTMSRDTMDETFDEHTSLGVLIDSRLWTSALNALGRASNREFSLGMNISYGEDFRKDRLVTSELYTREGIKLKHQYDSWRKENQEALKTLANEGANLPTLTDDWSMLETQMEPKVPDELNS